MFWVKFFVISLAIICINGAERTQSRLGQSSGRQHVDGHTQNSNAEPLEDDSDYLPSFKQRFDDFDWKLFQAISAADTSNNVIVSTISLKLVLAMLREGATGPTADELIRILELPASGAHTENRFKGIVASLKSSPNDSFTLDLGSKIYLDQLYKTEQKVASILKTTYETDIKRVDFKKRTDVSNEINNWVRNLTHGKIDKMVDEDDVANAVMYILNAIYFKGQWRYQFEQDKTYVDKFYINDRESVSTEYMHNTGNFFYSESQELDAKILRLPYKGKKFAMLLVLPNSKTGLNQVVKKMSTGNYAKALNDASNVFVDVSIPKFGFEYTSKMVPFLQELGVKQIFQSTANLAGFVRGTPAGQPLVFVSDIMQKAGIEINEEGTVAVAATDVQLGNKFGTPDYFFNITHPFLFLIEDETTGTLLFVGKVNNPSLKAAISERIPMLSESVSDIFNLGDKFETPSADALIPSPPASMTSEPTGKFNYFDTELLEAISDSEPGNILISPASIKATLSMILEGAQGQCAKEIRDALRFHKHQRLIREQIAQFLKSLQLDYPGVEIESANSILLSKNISPNPQYTDILKTFYDAEMNHVDFNDPSVATAINRWVSDKTRGLISKVLDSDHIQPDTKLLILNVLYFKGLWEKTFSPDDTIPRCFHPTPKICVDCYMMESIDFYNYADLSQQLDAQAVELSYKDNRYSMLIIVPKQRDGITKLIRKLKDTDLDLLISSLKRTEISFGLPRFKIEYSVELVPILQSLKIRDLFSERANLSGIAGMGNLQVNNVFQKSAIIVNEDGSTAASVSGAAIIPLMQTSQPNVRADRPFVFFIYDSVNNAVLFEGKVASPEYIDGKQKPARKP